MFALIVCVLISVLLAVNVQSGPTVDFLGVAMVEYGNFEYVPGTYPTCPDGQPVPLSAVETVDDVKCSSTPQNYALAGRAAKFVVNDAANDLTRDSTLELKVKDLQGSGTVNIVFWMRFATSAAAANELTPSLNPQTDLFRMSITKKAGPNAPKQSFPLELQRLTEPIVNPLVERGDNGFAQYRATISNFQVLSTDTVTLSMRSYQTRLATNVRTWLDIWVDGFTINLIQSGGNGDPQFVGLRGQSFQVHGIDGAYYNLVSSHSTQINAKFVFLDEGKCPIFDGIPATICWSHPGSYMGEIGIQQRVEGVVHKLLIVSGAAQTGFASVTLDSKPVKVGFALNHTDMFHVHYASSHKLHVTTEDFAFTFDNSDMFINYVAEATPPLAELKCHGLFGQTHTRKTYASSIKYIEGEVDDYLIGESDVFGTDFVFNQF